METHTEGPKKQVPWPGDRVETRTGAGLFRAGLVESVYPATPDQRQFLVRVPGYEPCFDRLVEDEGLTWRWPASGGGSVQSGDSPEPAVLCDLCTRFVGDAAGVAEHRKACLGEAAMLQRLTGSAGGGSAAAPYAGDMECPTCGAIAVRATEVPGWRCSKCGAVFRPAPAGGGSAEKRAHPRCSCEPISAREICSNCGGEGSPFVAGGGSPALGFCGPLLWSRGKACCPDCDHNRGVTHCCAGCGMEGAGAADLGPAPPEGVESKAWGTVVAPAPVKRCLVRLSDDGEAIELCETIIGRELRCFVCDGRRCFIHCGCLAHHTGAKTVARGSHGSFEWCVWELEYAFRGQLYCRSADGSGLVILGTHGGASAEAVTSILFKSLERIQGRRLPNARGAVELASGKTPTPTMLANAAAGEVQSKPLPGDLPDDPERELQRADTHIVLLLDKVKRVHAAQMVDAEKLRVWALRISQDWLRVTEQRWRDLADDSEQNPRLVWRAKELHDQQVSDLFFQIGQLFRSAGES